MGFELLKLSCYDRDYDNRRAIFAQVGQLQLPGLLCGLLLPNDERLEDDAFMVFLKGDAQAAVEQIRPLLTAARSHVSVEPFDASNLILPSLPAV